MSTQLPGSIQTFTGTINPISFTDSSENAIVMLTCAAGEYGIIPKGAGVDLADRVGSTVEVKGIVFEKNELSFLHARSYQIVGDFENEWYDDDE